MHSTLSATSEAETCAGSPWLLRPSPPADLDLRLEAAFLTLISKHFTAYHKPAPQDARKEAQGRALHPVWQRALRPSSLAYLDLRPQAALVTLISKHSKAYHKPALDDAWEEAQGCALHPVWQRAPLRPGDVAYHHCVRLSSWGAAVEVLNAQGHCLLAVSIQQLHTRLASAARSTRWLSETRVLHSKP